MRHAWMLGAAIGLGIGAGAALGGRTGALAQSEGVWLRSLDAAESAARNAKKPIFLVFR